uniref:DUF4203 domain-containing protein n=1 Tax=Parastrongyloides trichosuri TaxID=131310 RepID=A0A0N4ZTP7_PARTI
MAAAQEISQIAQQYQDEFQRNALETGELVTTTAKEAVSTVQKKVDEIAPTALGYKDHAVGIITNFSEAKINGKEIMGIMLWASVLLIGCRIGALLAHFLLYPFVGLIFDGSTALYLTAIFIPVYVHFKQSREPLSEEKSRFRLLGYAIAQGLIVGYIQVDSFLLSQDPFAFLGLAVMGIAALFLTPIFGGNRLNFLGAVAGSGFAVHFVLGLVLGQLGAIYLLMSILYSAVVFILLQYYLHAATSKNVALLYMYYNFIAVIYIQLVFFYIFGYTKEDYKKYIASEAQNTK